MLRILVLKDIGDDKLLIIFIPYYTYDCQNNNSTTTTNIIAENT